MRAIIIALAVVAVGAAIGVSVYLYAPVPTTPAAPSAATTGTGVAATLPGTPVSYTVLKEGTDAPRDMGRGNYRIKDADQLAQLWQILFGPGGPKPPVIDFKSQEVLAVFDGTHATGGYSVSVDGIADDGSRTIALTHTAPGSACQVTQAVSAPYQVVSVPKTTLSLAHVDEDATDQCR